MLAIAHMSPLSVSILIDRQQYWVSFVTPSQIDKPKEAKEIEAFLKAENHDNLREKLLLVEKVSTIQRMLKDGWSLSDVKVIVFDDWDVIKQLGELIDVETLDQKFDAKTSTHQKYRFNVDEMHQALGWIPYGVDSALPTFQSEPEVKMPDVDPTEQQGKRRGRRPKTSRPSILDDEDSFGEEAETTSPDMKLDILDDPEDDSDEEAVSRRLF